MKKVTLGIAAVLLAGLLAAPVSATVMIPLSDADLVQHANTIVVGKAIALQSVREGGQIATHITIDIQETLKGTAHEQVEVWVPGGFDNSGPVPVGTLVPGAPMFFPNEEVLLFLEQPAGLKSNNYVVLGLVQGKFSVVTDPAGEKSYVRRVLGGFHLPNGEAVSNEKTVVALDAFKARIQHLMDQAQ